MRILCIYARNAFKIKRLKSFIKSPQTNANYDLLKYLKTIKVHSDKNLLGVQCTKDTLSYIREF